MLIGPITHISMYRRRVGEHPNGLFQSIHAAGHIAQTQTLDKPGGVKTKR